VHPPAGFRRRCTLQRKPDISLANKTGQVDVLITGIKTGSVVSM
jgi:hypothetical protein